MTEQLMTPEEVGSIFKVHAKTVIKLFKMGKLAGICVNYSSHKPRIRFRESDVKKFISEQLIEVDAQSMRVRSI